MMRGTRGDVAGCGIGVNPVQINPAIPGTLTRVAVGDVGRPRLSADGTTVVYDQWVNEQWDVMRWCDGKTQALSTDPHHDVDPRVSADGRTVVWSRMFENNDGSTTTFTDDVLQWQDGKTTTVAGSDQDEQMATVSGDGKTVAWSYDEPNGAIAFDIQTRKDGVTTSATTGWQVDIDPLLNDDGSRLFFRRKVHLDDGDMWLRDETGKERQLTNDPWGEFDPTIDGAGRTLVWADARKGFDILMQCDVDSGKTQAIQAEEHVDNSVPSLSVDGHHLAWARRDRKSGTDPQIMLSDNGVVTPLTTEGWNSWPSISKDGRVISWINVDGKTTSIYRFERSQTAAQG